MTKNRLIVHTDIRERYYYGFVIGACVLAVSFLLAAILIRYDRIVTANGIIRNTCSYNIQSNICGVVLRTYSSSSDYVHEGDTLMLVELKYNDSRGYFVDYGGQGFDGTGCGQLPFSISKEMSFMDLASVYGDGGECMQYYDILDRWKTHSFQMKRTSDGRTIAGLVAIEAPFSGNVYYYKDNVIAGDLIESGEMIAKLVDPSCWEMVSYFPISLKGEISEGMVHVRLRSSALKSELRFSGVISSFYSVSSASNYYANTRAWKNLDVADLGYMRIAISREEIGRDDILALRCIPAEATLVVGNNTVLSYIKEKVHSILNKMKQ